MLTFGQKFIQFCIPPLKTQQPVLPYQGNGQRDAKVTFCDKIFGLRQWRGVSRKLLATLAQHHNTDCTAHKYVLT